MTGVDDPVHAIDEVLDAYDRAWEPKRLELLPVDEFGLFRPSPAPEEARARGLRPEYRAAVGAREAS